jgi:D-beta-D-heptose 7-phosphate kinase/D-beta-D-heptose 1-phosphate adenosyltransferase
MVTLEGLIDSFPDKSVLVVGDLMLDRFIYGDVRRISPEAPVQVIDASDPEEIAGGAGNVARNVVALGASCEVVGIVGRDEAGARIQELLSQVKVNALLVDGRRRMTTVKTRYVANLHSTHLLRADREDTTAIAGALEDKLLGVVLERIPRADVILLSDYQKGVLTPRLIAAIVEHAGKANKPVVVDPKGSDYRRYRGVTALTPNLAELSRALGRPIASDVGSVTEAATELLDMTESQIILVTMGEKGLVAVSRDDSTAAFEATARRVVDVSGAGDTVVGSFALALAAGASVQTAAKLANAAAGVVVSKKSTATVSAAELRATLLSRPQSQFLGKIFAGYSNLALRVAEWRDEGRSIGFTNGCFDLLHPGHIHLLCEARSRCDRLIVGLNSDQSVKRLKGESRPVQPEIARAQVMAALEFVDAVSVFQEDTPLEILRFVRPDILIKGADYQINQVVGREFVEGYGGRISLIDLVPDSSTSRIVGKVLGNNKTIEVELSSIDQACVPIGPLDVAEVSVNPL